MISFEKFYEGFNFTMAPTKVLGLHNSLKDLPKEPPYGFWVNKHGNFVVVDHMGGHNRIAKQIIQAYNQHEINQNEHLKDTGVLYHVMYEHGFIRVITIGGREVMWEHVDPAYNLTPAQKKTLDWMGYIYEAPVERDFS